MENIVSSGQPRKNRIRNLEFELGAWQIGHLVCGIDEVGRGPLAGPVVAAAVVLFPDSYARCVKDSKLLDALQLEKAAKWVREHSWYGVGVADQAMIDRHNIHGATCRAMRRAVSQLMTTCPRGPELVLIDAVKLRVDDCIGGEPTVQSFIKAESRSISVAAASIIAKVTRDALMQLHEIAVPGYGFAAHKAYATAEHKRLLLARGHSIIHRISFVDHIVTNNEQQSILW
ncbi:ribonuclease HII [Candidatus Dependentiae bacterium]|nr:ribonuclease HII [Candidatus Dependentiae bacterium]